MGEHQAAAMRSGPGAGRGGGAGGRTAAPAVAPARGGSARRGRRIASLGLACAIAGAWIAAPATAQTPSDEAYKYFEMNCASCHTIGGGRLAGPDLKDLLQRRDRDWLVPYILDPKRVIHSGDAYAQQLLREARDVIMPTAPGITKEMALKLLDIVELESGLETSRFAGLQISDRPLTAADVERGRQLFWGEAALMSGAPACFSCHDVAGGPGFGGGRLGPDLTAVYSRLAGRQPLAAWLSAPPSVTMGPVFRATPIDGEEILALVAYFQQAAAGGVEAAEPGTLAFLLTGFGLAAALLVLFDVAWQGRYHATRRPLVERRLVDRRMAEEVTR